MLNLIVHQARAGVIDKVFLEPYLRTRWRLPHHVVRFQGRRAARHDDHVCVQLK